jgi:radical SAM protein with 4Fe4S-binding SPASM domain
MENPKNGLEFLENLREKRGSGESSFDDFAEYLEQRARIKGVPIHGQFELTPLCNFDCKMCYTHLSAEQMRGRVPLKTEQWKDLIRQAYELGMYQATLTGGECLLYPGFEELFLYLHSLGCEVNVLTNGEMLDEKWVSFFEKHTPASIQITLYGNDDESYEKVTGRRVFDKVLKNIRRVSEADLPLRIAITPNVFLRDSMIDTVRLAKSLCRDVRINTELFDPREDTGRSGMDFDLTSEEYVHIYRALQEIDGIPGREIPDELLPPPGGGSTDRSKRGVQCGGGRSGFVITWDGKMYPCNRLTEVEMLPLKEGLANAWQKINNACNNWPRVAECDGCPYYAVCDNCPANMTQYAVLGKRPTKICERARFLVRHGIREIEECK